MGGLAFKRSKCRLPFLRCAIEHLEERRLLAATPPQHFVLPLGGSPDHDWTIWQYFDHDDTAGIRDYAGGDITIDGHPGTDFGLSSLSQFAGKATGAPVSAAADGVVASFQSSPPSNP